MKMFSVIPTKLPQRVVSNVSQSTIRYVVKVVVVDSCVSTVCFEKVEGSKFGNGKVWSPGLVNSSTQPRTNLVWSLVYHFGRWAPLSPESLFRLSICLVIKDLVFTHLNHKILFKRAQVIVLGGGEFRDLRINVCTTYVLWVCFFRMRHSLTTKF